MQAAALLLENPNPTDEKIIEAMEGNLCRCGTYLYIKQAVKRAVREGKSS
jgi:isoquinoline 1-oxidoreductase alpha subunit